MHQFLKFIFGIKFWVFRTVPLSIIRSFSLYTQQWYMSYRLQLQLASRIRRELQFRQQTCMTYTIAVCTVKNFWWCTQELSEICREISASSWFYYKNLSRCTVTCTSNSFNHTFFYTNMFRSVLWSPSGYAHINQSSVPIRSQMNLVHALTHFAVRHMLLVLLSGHAMSKERFVGGSAVQFQKR